MITTITMNPAIDKIFLVDDFTIHKLHRQADEKKATTTPGGKGVNISINLFRLGQADTVAMGFAGGHPGRMLVEMIREEGVATNFIYVEAHTRHDISIIDQKKNTLTEINESGKKIPQNSIDLFMNNLTKRLNRSKYVAIGGSIPVGNDKTIYGEMVKMIREKGVKSLVHTSPDNIMSAVKEGATVIAPDMRSDHMIDGEKIDGIEDFIKKGNDFLKVNENIKLVLFTHRVENIVAVTRDNDYVLRPKDLKIVNMLGYCDAIMAALLYKLEMTDNMSEALTFAAAAGLTNIESVGKQLENIKSVEANISRITIAERGK